MEPCARGRAWRPVVADNPAAIIAGISQPSMPAARMPDLPGRTDAIIQSVERPLCHALFPRPPQELIYPCGFDRDTGASPTRLSRDLLRMPSATLIAASFARLKFGQTAIEMPDAPHLLMHLVPYDMKNDTAAPLNVKRPCAILMLAPCEVARS